jgi:glycogen debranching enzyme
MADRRDEEATRAHRQHCPGDPDAGRLTMADDETRDTALRFEDESEPVPSATVTLVEGASFAICDAAGDITEGSVEGLFVADTRICSRLVLSVDGGPLDPLTVADTTPFEATFVARSRDRDLLVFRDMHVGRGMRLDIRVRNLSTAPRPFTATLAVRADLADLFEVKEGRAKSVSAPCEITSDGLLFADDSADRGLVVCAAAGEPHDDGTLTWSATLEPHVEWSCCVELAALRGGERIEPRYRCGQPSHTALPAARQARWQAEVPEISTDIDGLGHAFDRAAEDLGGLRLFDGESTEPLIAAGAPWYMTRFGRDSLLTAWMALLLDPDLARSTLAALARLQGRHDDPVSEEEPGRILHEVRFSSTASLALADGDVYYGSADATPLFVMLVHELWRWGTPLDDIRPLLPAVDAALGWIAGSGDRDGDGYVEYAPRSPGSLRNQGWKDSGDGISYADGRLAEPPIALAEVQAYAYAAWRAGAALAAATGDFVTASARRARAEALQDQFERDFWLPDREAFALGLDGEKRPIDAVASNMGHCLWAGLVRDRHKAAAVARWLVSPELFSGWGVRTLATTMGRFNPLSYHNGSVWPHDTAICVAGLRRAGFLDEALTLAGGLLRTAVAFGGRMPELFAGITPDDVAAPVPYPASCSPQAWSAAAPLLVARCLLGLEPDLPHGFVTIDPVLPPGSSVLRVSGIPLGTSRVTIEYDRDAVAVRGLPREVMLVRPAG